MIDSRSAGVLQAVFARQSRSFLQYVADSYPWTTPEAHQALGRLQGLVDEERHGLGELIRFLQRRRVTPDLPSNFPASFTNWNFVSLDALMPRLAQTARAEVARLEVEAAAVADSETQVLLRKNFEAHRRCLQALEALPATRPELALS